MERLVTASNRAGRIGKDQLECYVTKKVQERRMQWFGHIKRREEEYVGRRILDMEVEGRRQRGIPKKRFRIASEKT